MTIVMVLWGYDINVGFLLGLTYTYHKSSADAAKAARRDSMTLFPVVLNRFVVRDL